MLYQLSYHRVRDKLPATAGEVKHASGRPLAHVFLLRCSPDLPVLTGFEATT